MQIRKAVRRELATPSPISMSSHWKRQEEEEVNTELPDEPGDGDGDPVEDDPADGSDIDNSNGNGNNNQENNNNQDNLPDNNGGEDGLNDGNIGGENSEDISESPTDSETETVTSTPTTSERPTFFARILLSFDLLTGCGCTAGATEETNSDESPETETTPSGTDESSEEETVPPSTSSDSGSEEVEAEESTSSEREEDDSTDSSSISYTSTVYEAVSSSSSSAPEVSTSSEDDKVEITDAGPIAGIVVAGAIVLALLLWFLFKCCTSGDDSRDRRLGRRPVTASKKRTFWDDIPAPQDAEDKQPQQQPTLPSTALPEEAPPAFVGARRSQRSSPSASPSAHPIQHSHQSLQSGGTPVNQRKARPEVGGNVAEFTQRRPGVARAAAAAAGQTHQGAMGNATTGGQRTGYATTESEGQSQWVDVVDEKPLLNPYSNYG